MRCKQTKQFENIAVIVLLLFTKIKSAKGQQRSCGKPKTRSLTRLRFLQYWMAQDSNGYYWIQICTLYPNIPKHHRLPNMNILFSIWRTKKGEKSTKRKKFRYQTMKMLIKQVQVYLFIFEYISAIVSSCFLSESEFKTILIVHWCLFKMLKFAFGFWTRFYCFV